MTAIYIILIIIAMFALIALMRVGVYVEYSSDGVIIDLKAGPVKIRVLPAKEKKKSKEKTDKKEKTKKNKKKTSEKKETKKGGSFELVKQLLPGILETLNKFRKKISIDILKIYYMSAGEDPYKTAVQFGRASAGLGFLTPLLENTFKIKNRDFRTAVSFTEAKPLVYIEAQTTIAIGSALRIALGFLLYYLNLNKKTSERKAEK